jgi:hypothetical protein
MGIYIGICHFSKLRVRMGCGASVECSVISSDC